MPPNATPQDAERAKQMEAAQLTPSRLIAIHRLREHADWPVLWNLLMANFPLDDSIFVRSAGGGFDALDACKRDGQRDVMLFIRKIQALPTPAVSEEANLE